jgi:hypothetical protein
MEVGTNHGQCRSMALHQEGIFVKREIAEGMRKALRINFEDQQRNTLARRCTTSGMGNPRDCGSVLEIADAS